MLLRNLKTSKIINFIFFLIFFFPKEFLEYSLLDIFNFIFSLTQWLDLYNLSP